MSVFMSIYLFDNLKKCCPDLCEQEGTVDRAIGYLFLVIGVVFSLNAVFVGPHGFGAGLGGVIGSVIAGIVCAACGVWILVRRRKAG
jgi:nitrate reductase NapE component